MCDEKGCSGGVFIAFLAGGLIGAGLALLYAPVSGKEARDKITEFAGDLKKKSEGWSTDIKDKVESFIEEEKAVVKAAYDAGREAMAKEKAKFENPQSQT
jgi:gas vesicle protein